MGVWKAERGAKLNHGGMTSVFLDCMHDGCEPPKETKSGSSYVRKGQIHVLHDEGDDFITPRGLKFECAYCRENGPPSERQWVKD